jgi:hypothetical protein
VSAYRRVGVSALGGNVSAGRRIGVSALGGNVSAGRRVGGTRSRAIRRCASDADVRSSASDGSCAPARPASHVQ